MTTKNILKLLFFLSFFSESFSQVVSVNYILTGKVTPVKKMLVEAKNHLLLPTEFGDFTFLNEKILDSVKKLTIEKIDLVYTDYSESPTFSQPILNTKRLENLKEKVPHIFNNNVIEWNIICQTGAKNKQEAKDYFHGFVIYYKDNGKTKKEKTEDEISYIEDLLNKYLLKVGDTIKSVTDMVYESAPDVRKIIVYDTIIKIPYGKNKGKYLNIDPSKIKSSDYFEKKIKKELLIDKIPKYDTVLMVTTYSKSKIEKNKFIPRLKRKREKGIFYPKKSIWNRKPLVTKTFIKDTIYLKSDTLFIIEKCISPVYRSEGMSGIINKHFQDSIVLKTMNKLDILENKVIVEDVTGSMNPYLAQTFLWRRKTISSTKLSTFVYFNDGNSTLDWAKKIGETGGIYDYTSDSIQAIEAGAYNVMRLGSGGDCPENNLEALIYAQDKFPTLNPIMIADNNAPIKDISLLKKINKPIDIILCGVRYGIIQADYLTLIREVGGKVYTMERELEGLDKLKEGEIIEIGSQKLILSKGKFILTR